jgi:hypothetical protein
VTVGGDEASWSFRPENPWRAGKYAVRVDRTLEDLAGNGVGRPFEVDVFQKVERRGAAEWVDVPFEVVPAAR